jgi:hypothetical protein
MAKMGKYCKAYPVQRLREYKEWSEDLNNLRRITKEVDGKEVEVCRELDEDSFFYLQENYVVTDGIFLDENIIFDKVKPEWIDFCRNTLEFEVPVYEPVKAAAQ